MKRRAASSTKSWKRAPKNCFSTLNELHAGWNGAEPLEGVVLVGGGALLNGMCDMAERVLNCPARNGLLLGVEGWPDELKHPAWTTAGGLGDVLRPAQIETGHATKAPGLMGMILK